MDGWYREIDITFHHNIHSKPQTATEYVVASFWIIYCIEVLWLQFKHTDRWTISLEYLHRDINTHTRTQTVRTYSFIYAVRTTTKGSHQHKLAVQVHQSVYRCQRIINICFHNGNNNTPFMRGKFVVSQTVTIVESETPYSKCAWRLPISWIFW